MIDTVVHTHSVTTLVFGLIDVMSGDKMTVDEWLGGVYGPKMIGLPQKVIDTLTEASLDDTLLDDKIWFIFPQIPR